MLELDGATLTYEEFRRSCLIPNRPAIIRHACASADTVNFDVAEVLARLSPQALCSIIGPEAQVPVYSTFLTANVVTSEAESSRPHLDEDEDEEEEDGCCREVALAAVLSSWTDRPTTEGARVYYLKDWHLQEALEHAAVANATPAAATAGSVTTGDKVRLAATTSFAQRSSGVHGCGLYRVPNFLGVDWMDPFCRYMQPTPPTTPRESEQAPLTSSVDACGGDAGNRAGKAAHVGFGNSKSDYRFAYLGPVGSWTPLHCDVFGTYSWSFNVCGDKLWFFPTVDGNAYLHEHLPPFFPTPPDMRVLTGFEMEGVVQHPGDLVFVPSRFFHQVHNITGGVFPFSAGAVRGAAEGFDGEVVRGNVTATAGLVGPLTMSLNHNWCNVFNIACMTRAFLDDAQRLVSYLSVTDLEVICDTTDAAVWRDYADTMLHSGTNWSFASMTCFLEFCLRSVEDGTPEMTAAEEEREMAVALLRQLLSDVTASHARLFTT